MPTLKIKGTGTELKYKFRASGPITPGDDTEGNDKVNDNEARGALNGKDTDSYEFKGVPTAFAADNPWDGEYHLDMGGGYTRMVPPYLNAAVVDVRSKGAHYLLSMPAPGMLLKGGTADPKDGVLDEPNQLVTGNVRNGGKDSWRAWPPVGVSGVADNPAKFRVRGSKKGWRDMTVVSPTMEF